MVDIKLKFKATQPVMNESRHVLARKATACVDWGLLKWDIFSNSCVQEEQVCARKISFRCDYFWQMLHGKQPHRILVVTHWLESTLRDLAGRFPAPNHLPLYDWSPAPVDTYKNKNRRFSIPTRARCLWTVSLAGWAFCIDSLRILIIHHPTTAWTRMDSSCCKPTMWMFVCHYHDFIVDIELFEKWMNRSWKIQAS